MNTFLLSHKRLFFRILTTYYESKVTKLKQSYIIIISPQVFLMRRNSLWYFETQRVLCFWFFFEIEEVRLVPALVWFSKKTNHAIGIYYKPFWLLTLFIRYYVVHACAQYVEITALIIPALTLIYVDIINPLPSLI